MAKSVLLKIEQSETYLLVNFPWEMNIGFSGDEIAHFLCTFFFSFPSRYIHIFENADLKKKEKDA